MSYVVNPFTGDLTPVTDIPSGSVIGPGSSTVGDIAVWNNTTGTLLADSGIKFTTDGTLAANSDALTPTEKAVKTYADTKISGTTTVHDVIIGTGTNTVTSIANGTTGQFLGANTGADPTWQTPPTVTVTQYDALSGDAANGIRSFGPGTAGQVYQSGGAGANPSYSSATYPVSTTINQMLYSSAANTITGLATANNGVHVTNATGVPSVLAGPGTTGNMLLSNAAAAPSFSSNTFPSTSTINDIFYASAANTISSLASVSSRLLATNSSGVPGWRTTVDFNFSVIRSVGGSTVTMQVQNQSNTANSNAAYIATTSGSSSGDPLYRFETGVTTWCLGVQNSVSSPSADPLKISLNATPGTNDYMIMQSTGEVSWPLQSAFRATLSADATNVTGNGTAYTLACNTEAYDQNSDYDNTTYTFTAPVTGIYHFDVNVFMYGVVAATSIDVKLTNSAGTTLQDLHRLSGVNVVASSTIYVISGSTNLKLTAADTVKVVVLASGEASDVIDIQSGTSSTAFSGWLVC